ncbi:helicase-related protein [Lactobacillaceae bacterium 24-114]
MDELEMFYGRRVLWPKVEERPAKGPDIVELATIEVGERMIHCHRCNAYTDKFTGTLPNNQYYCPNCISLGRVSTLNYFYHVPEPNKFIVPDKVLSWQGQLSPLQRKTAETVKRNMDNHCHQLLWAVTGAGKTEMMFNAIASALSRGERIAVASPRVDVCLELYPRLQKAFTDFEIALLHGKESTSYAYRQFTVCTTHQLLRFYHAFDNLIVDEVDSFPYAANQSLLYATHQAIKPNGGLLFMTATPGKKLLTEIKKKRLKVSYLPLRYHGNLLPRINLRLAFNWRKKLLAGKLPADLLRAIQKSNNNHYRCLLFVPHVADLEPVAQCLRRQLPKLKFATVHAEDEQRLEKIQKMRKGIFDLLVTTTILERGVTFPEIDVYGIGVDEEIFSSSALVQIAGRAGRANSRPTGDVIFWAGVYTKTIREAQRQIDFMNHKGRRLKDE